MSTLLQVPELTVDTSQAPSVDPSSAPLCSPSRKRVVKRVNAEEAALLEKQAEQRRMNGRRGMAFYGDAPTVVSGLDPMGFIPVAPCSNSGLLSPSVDFDKSQVPTTRRLCPSKHLLVAYAETQGRRPSMEDEFFIWGGIGGNPDLDVVGLFDGHNGDLVSKFLAVELPEVFQAVVAEKKTICEDLVKEVFLKTSILLKEKKIIGGSTSIVSIFDHAQKKVFIANVGDCRAVLGSPGIGKRISEDHRPGSQQEKDRIESLGGTVNSLVNKDGRVISRVNGLLAVSRSFGDFELEEYIKPVPDVFEVNFKDLSEGFLIIACDGLWDVMGDNDATDIVKRHFEIYGNDLEGACVRLRDFAYANGSTDNITAFIVSMNTSLPKPSPNLVAFGGTTRNPRSSALPIPDALMNGNDVRRRTDGGSSVAPLADFKVAGTGKRNIKVRSTRDTSKGKDKEGSSAHSDSVDKKANTETVDVSTKTKSKAKTTSTTTTTTVETTPTVTDGAPQDKIIRPHRSKKRDNRHTWDGQEYSRQQQKKERGSHREKKGTIPNDPNDNGPAPTKTKRHKSRRREDGTKRERKHGSQPNLAEQNNTENEEVKDLNSKQTKSNKERTTSPRTKKGEAGGGPGSPSNNSSGVLEKPTSKSGTPVSPTIVEISPTATTTTTTTTGSTGDSAAATATTTTTTKPEEKKSVFSWVFSSRGGKRMSIWKKDDHVSEDKGKDRDKKTEKEIQKENKAKFENRKDRTGRRATIQ